MTWIIENSLRILQKTMEHAGISFLALIIGSIIAIPAGILLTRAKKLAQIVISIASVLQTIPSLALLAIMVPLFGVGKKPAIVALVIYSLLPILRNTFLGMDSVDKSLLDASYGMGMSTAQVLYKVQVPLALPVIMAGVRVSSVYVVAWTTLAAYIGAGGLGDLIFMGLNNYNFEAILAGAVPVTLLALLFDYGLGFVEKKLRPKIGRNEVKNA
jgi:osmoprotectant transport system permease protein